MARYIDPLPKVLVAPGDRALLQHAADIQGLPLTSFVRVAALRVARDTLRQADRPGETQ